MADDGLEGFIPAPLTTPCEQSRGDTGTGTGAGAGAGAGTGTDTGTEMKAIDPTGLPMCDVLLTLQQAVAECIDADSGETAHSYTQDNMKSGPAAGAGGGAGVSARQDPSMLSPDVPLISLGMDSMRGIQLQALLESRFTVQLPDELMFEPDATLRTIAHGKISRNVCVAHCKISRNVCVAHYKISRNVCVAHCKISRNVCAGV